MKVLLPSQPDSMTMFWVGFAASLIVSLPLMSLLRRRKVGQTISAHAPEAHQAKQGTPTMGGIMILVGFLVSLLFAKKNVDVVPIGVLVGLFGLIGFVDDYVIPKLMPGKRGLGWIPKLLMQFGAAVIPFFLMPGGVSQVGGINVIISVFCIVFFANAYNFADGLDALAGMLLFFMALGMQVLSIKIHGSEAPYQLVLGLLGALIPFLFWNAPKTKVFMGDVGSLPIGAFLGGFWFLVSSRSPGIPEFVTPSMAWLGSPAVVISFLIWSLMMILELVPVPLQIASVKIRKKKLFPYTPIHHAFEKAGWPETRVVFWFALLQFLCSMLSNTILGG